MKFIEKKIQKNIGIQFNKMWETALNQFNQSFKEHTDRVNKEIAQMPPIDIPKAVEKPLPPTRNLSVSSDEASSPV